MKDLFGRALFDFQTQNKPEDIITETTISEPDTMDVGYLFRSLEQMPTIEQKALQHCRGSILDVGCGAGSHSLYLQEKGFQVKAIDHSALAVATCRLRGLQNVHCQSLLSLHNEQFDTILLLMNGTGIFETLQNCSRYLQHLQKLLKPDGQILVDSSDLLYMYDRNADGSYSVPAWGYYGELTFTLHYKGETELPFPWLYLDYNTLQNAAIAKGFRCTLLAEGTHFDYLAQLTKL